MLTYGLSPFFAGAKLLIICEIHKFFAFFLQINAQNYVVVTKKCAYCNIITLHFELSIPGIVMPIGAPM